jgi:hypothetical protein
MNVECLRSYLVKDWRYQNYRRGFMNASKKNHMLVAMSGLPLASFLILMTAIKGDSVLRIVLASVGFVGFVGLYVALLVASKRTPSG